MKQQLLKPEFPMEEMGLNHIFKWCLDKTGLILARLLSEANWEVRRHVYHLTHPDDEQISSVCSGIAGGRGCNTIIMIPITILARL